MRGKIIKIDKSNPQRHCLIVKAENTIYRFGIGSKYNPAAFSPGREVSFSQLKNADCILDPATSLRDSSAPVNPVRPLKTLSATEMTARNLVAQSNSDLDSKYFRQ